MSNPEHVAILREGQTAWNTWREAYPRIVPDLRNEDLTFLRDWPPLDAEVREVFTLNFLGTLLAGATLEGVDLGMNGNRGVARFSGAHLEGVNFANANLEWVVFPNARLVRANLEGANLRGAHLGRANLRGARLANANLMGSKFRSVRLSGTDVRDANFAGAGLQYTDLSGANFTFEQLVLVSSLWKTMGLDPAMKEQLWRAQPSLFDENYWAPYVMEGFVPNPYFRGGRDVS